MTIRWSDLTACALILSLAATAQSPAPLFSAFSVAERYNGPPATPVLRSAQQRKFRAQILKAAKQPADFAGHYKIADWGCGSSCVSIAVIDLKTGSVYDGPFSILGYGSPQSYEGGDDWLEFHVSSRLLVARGCPEDKNCGTYYFEWQDAGFRLLRTVHSGPPKAWKGRDSLIRYTSLRASWRHREALAGMRGMR